ncbi:MAG: VacJ family lipoprotein, partial [Desulfamplus sp.]|nr:VacJ family lipoprotein [Desulfamplus sp.]
MISQDNSNLMRYFKKILSIHWLFISLVLIMIFCTSSFAANEPLDDELYGDEYVKSDEQSVSDPLYWFNYAMFSFNDKLYFWVLKPAAQGYKFITPAKLRNGLKNFFHNALFPVRFVNNILQGKGEQAFSEAQSFVINTVGGGLGFATPADYVFGIKNYEEDMGQTLGRYSLKEGFYLVLPLIGPSTLRDTVGFAGDFFLSPTSYVEPPELAAGVGALEQ